MRRLGKRAAVADDRVPRLRTLLVEDAFPPPSCNWYAGVSAWPMLANDRLGDCVPAGALHCIAQRFAYAQHPVSFTDDDAVVLYERWGGYVKGEPSTDQGTLLSSALAAWARDGVPVLDGIDRLETYAAVDHVSAGWLKRAIWRCGGVLVGLRCPSAWLSASYLLDLPDGPPDNAGGHCVYLAGYEPTALGVEYDCITWGGRFRVTERALLAVVDEAYCVLSRDWFDASGVDPAGIDFASAERAMTTIRAA